MLETSSNPIAAYVTITLAALVASMVTTWLTNSRAKASTAGVMQSLTHQTPNKS